MACTTLIINRTLMSKVSLPSKEDMIKDTQEEAEWRKTELKMPDKHFHKMGVLQWKYNKEIAALGNLEPISDSVENLYNAVHERRRKYLPYYKNDSYQIKNATGYCGKIYDPETGNFTTID